jgi:hypothetical protein
MDFSFAVSLFRTDDVPLGQFPVDVDWEPAIEWCRFAALRGGSAEPSDEARVEPVWHRKRGAPFVEGFQVAFGGERSMTFFSAAYFREPAERIVSRLVEAGKLDTGAPYVFAPVAYRKERDESPLAFTTEDAAPPSAPEEGSLADYLAEATRSPAAKPGEPNEDAPVFIPQNVLAEVDELTRSAGANETGGVLLGHLYRDSSVPEVFAVVTAQVHARHARADSVSLHFTAGTWTDVRAALNLRRRKERMLGWWHSHPVATWCARCSEQSQRSCRLANDFFSDHDRGVHRTVFPKAYSVALVVNGIGFDDFTHSLFGWREGLVHPRGFHVMEAT